MFEEFYNENTPYFDEQIDELKESLKKSIKKEVLDKMEKLEKENKELSDVKKNFNEIKADFERKKNEYDSKLKDLESEKETVYNITLKDKKEMKRICNFGFREKDGSPHVCKVNCECEFATFGICNEDGSYGYGKLHVL